MVAIASGLWFDHSKPPILAATLTVPVDSGYLLISALTLLVTFAGASFWSIIAFVLHNGIAKGTTTNVLGLQFQVSLRNSAGAIRTLWESLKIYQAWSKTPPKQLLLHTCTVAIPAFLIPAGFVVAGLHTSRVATKTYGNVIARVQPNNCGFWNFDQTTDGSNAMARKTANDTIQARNHVASFYAKSSSSASQPIFVQPTLPYSVNSSAPCPIPAADRCILGRNKAFSITSAFLDSHDMLGVNAKVDDRIRVQLGMTCSPLNVRDLTLPADSADNPTIRYFLGPISDVSNSTYHYNTRAGNNSGIGYSIRSIFAYADTPRFTNLSVWKPISDMNRTDADVSLHFLNQNDMRYMGPVYDPWFSANGTFNYTYGGILFVAADAFVNTMACADQYVLCNPSTSSCTSPAGLFTLLEHVSVTNKLEFNAAQLATAQRILVALAGSSTFSTVASLGSSALWANNLVVNGNISPSLPANQWQIEVLGWFQTNLVKLQASLLDYASNTAGPGPFGSVEMRSNQRVGAQLSEAEARVLLDQCANQLVQATGQVQNFSLCGVLVIVCVSAAIVLLDCSLERIVDFFGHRDSAPRRARQADSKLHLLRMALRGNINDRNSWNLGRWDIPVRDSVEPVDRPTISKGLVIYEGLVGGGREAGGAGDGDSQDEG